MYRPKNNNFAEIFGFRKLESLDYRVVFVNRGTMSVHSLPKTVPRQRRSYDLNLDPSVPKSSTR